jgi:hypothetical protein
MSGVLVDLGLINYLSTQCFLSGPWRDLAKPNKCDWRVANC